MTAQPKRRVRWWVGTLILLGIPAAFVCALAAYVRFQNARPQTGPLRVSVQPEVIFPWQQAHFQATVSGKPKPSDKQAESLDIAFLVDVSGSMTESIPTMADAVRVMARHLAASKGKEVRFALAAFDTEAHITVPWTQDSAALDRGLSDLHAFEGNNDPRQIFNRINDLNATARPGVKRAMVFYTDGVIATTCPEDIMGAAFLRAFLCSPDSMTYSEAAAAAKPLRDAGIDLFCVGRPGDDPHPVMLQITGSSSRIFRPSGIRDLASKFAALTDAVAKESHVGTELSQSLDGRHFRAPLEGTSWVRDPTGALRLDIGRLPRTAATFGHPLVPLDAGLWRVGSEPMRLTYADASGEVSEARAQTRPRILVLTWAVLMLPFLPWLVWLLFRSMPAKPQPEVPPPPVPVRVPPLPAALPPLPRPPSTPPPVPTLFVGLGGTGLEALHAIRADLEQLHLGAAGNAHRFLALDVDQREPAASKFPSSGAPSIERIVAPRDTVQLRDVPRPGEVPPELSWFDVARYEHAAREELNLADGAKGDRILARLALFRWLARPDRALVGELERAVDGLLNAPAGAAAPRQIVVVGSPAGGVGSGWFADVSRLLRRITRARQRSSEVIPEIVGVLVSTTGAPDTTALANRAALLGELETIALTGHFPRRVVMQADDELLERTDTESPFDWVIEVSDADAASAAAQGGAVAAMLCQNRVRHGLLREVGKQERIPARVATTGVHVLSTLARDQVQADLLLRLLGPDVLLDVEPVRGGYAPRRLEESEVRQSLETWVADEPPRTPLQRLLAGDATAEDPSVLHALRMSVNRRLRQWQPVLASATLRAFSERLGDASPAARWAATVADSLDGWVRELAVVAAAASDRRHSNAARMQAARSVSRRHYLDSMIDAKAVDAASRTCLERWLGTADTLTPLRQRLFFSVEASDAVVLRSHVAEPVVLTSAGDAASALNSIAAAVAAAVPSLRLSGAVARMDEQQRQKLADTLLQSGLRADAVIVAAPADLEDFSRLTSQPASDGVRGDCTADDVSSIRRASVAAPAVTEAGVAKPPYVETAERESDRIRLRIAERYRIRVPVLPPELRVAAAHPSRFQSFARAYESGGIVRKPDESGQSRWYAVDRQEFLGFQEQADLAEAAANYVYSDTPAAEPAVQRAPGDFSALDEGIAHGGALNEEGLVQAAVRVAKES